MDDMKSYTVRVETGEIRLMSQEEVSKLVRTTMARAESGAQNTKKPTKFARSKGNYTIASDLSRRLSLSPRPLSSARALHLGKNPEELSKSPTSKLFQDFRAAVSNGAISSPPEEESRNDNNSLRTDMKEPSRSKDKQFSALVRTVGPKVIDPENDPRDVSFTVSTEVDGPKNLSEKELHALVRSSIIRAKFNARHKKSRRKQESSAEMNSTIQSPDSSPTKRLSRKFSWSTVEKSDDDEEFEDFRDDEIVNAKNDMTDIRQESETRDQTSIDNLNAVDDMVNAEKNDISAHGSGEIFITPCTSSKHDAVDLASPKQIDDVDDFRHTTRQHDSQLISLVMSGGDTSMSDKDICNMVKHSMAKAKLTRQEITDLLEDTPSGVTKMDVANIFEGTMRRARDSSRVLGVKSLSPRRRRSLGLNLTRTEVAPIYQLPSIASDSNNALANIASSEITNSDVCASTEIIVDIEKEKTSMRPEEAECNISTSLNEVGVLTLDTEQDSKNPVMYPASEDDKNVLPDQDTAPEEDKKGLEDPAIDVDVCVKADTIVLPQPIEVQPSDTDNEIHPPSSINEISPEIGDTVPHREQNNSCCFQMCCMPIILSSSSVAEKEELDGAAATLNVVVGELHQGDATHSEEELLMEQNAEVAIHSEEMPLIDQQHDETIQSEELPKPKIDIESSVDVETKPEELENESMPPPKGQENIIDLTDVNSTDSVSMSSAVHEEMVLLNDDECEQEMFMKPLEHVVSDSPDQGSAAEKTVPFNVGDHEPQISAADEIGAVLPEKSDNRVEPEVEPLDSKTIDETPCLTCFHVPMNPEVLSIEEKNEQQIVEHEKLNIEHEDNDLIVSDHNKSVLLEPQKDVTTLPMNDLTTRAEKDESTIEQKSHSKAKRAKFSKYKRFKDYYEVKTVITDEFLNEVISRKGSKMSVSELAMILKGEPTKTIVNDKTGNDDNDSALQNHSADETLQSDRTDIEEKIDPSLEQRGFCMDFLAIFSDLDLRGDDDEFGSASLFQDDSRAVTWIESVVDAESKDEITDHGAADAEDERPPKSTEYESEFVASLDENERRRLTFSFSDGRYTGSLSSLDDY